MQGYFSLPFEVGISNFLANISPGTLWIVFTVFILLSAIMSFVLIYHWNKYRLHSPATTRAVLVYVLGLVIILALGAVSLSVYTF